MRVKSKIVKSMAVLYKIMDKLGVGSLKLLYSSLVLPYIKYCIEVWGNTYKSNVHPIYVLQKKTLRISGHPIVLKNKTPNPTLLSTSLQSPMGFRMPR